ncbi:MAG: DEAD/DEAH box helicase [Terrimicrobiaceae bacterium]|nr:DEAD/DEAH box helicase [Terrimicrobiaceae bacterium]
MELTEKLLISMAGWPVFKQAQAIHAAGRVIEAGYEPPLLKGRLAEGGKQFLCGLKLRNSIDVENLCPCGDSRLRGIICAHSVAIGLQVLKPNAAPSEPTAAASSRPAPTAATGEIPVVSMTLEGSLRHVEADVRFAYANPGAANPAAEAAVLAELLEAGFRDFAGRAALQGEAAVLRFFATTLPRWRAKWRVAEGARFAHVTRDFVRIEPQFAIRETDGGWLDVQIHHTAGTDALLTHADLARLLQSGQPHLKLKSGKIAVADPGLAADLEEVLRDCNPRQEGGAYRVAPEYRGYLEASIAQWKGAAAGSPGLSAKDLGPLQKRLRPYQVEGAAWLLERARAGLGGLIADEMGLGKTVQALAMIEALGEGAALVVCPSSLVWNWRREAEQFLPGLPVLTLDGPGRESRFAAIPAHRLVITSYALLRRDIDRYRGIRFAAVLLDEAQHIKNPDSQNAKAAGALEAASRFILTGTPVENSVRDLWSLFEFLLPGYLGGRGDFRDRYETPLLNGACREIWARLSRRIAPYLLRRRKQDVLTDLPEKIEQVLEVELTDAQRAAYSKLQEAARSQIDRLRDQGRAGAARMRVLTALLRLRQACCDLRLLGASGEDLAVSAKLAALRELLGEAIDGGHRVLVFSQFTSMLDLIERALDADGIAFCRLDGSTKDRGAVVNRFQTDAAIPVFLISLKAGGVGLNLTAADTVIHFDPWWNPAVEAQATDRAHRIGQKSVVTAIKLIARGTIEERVLALQQRKREWLAGAMDAETALAGLDADELAELVG